MGQKRVYIIMLILLYLALTNAQCPAPQQNVVMGYIQPALGNTNRQNIAELDGNKLTHVMYAFASFLEDGTVTLQGNVAGVNMSDVATKDNSNCDCQGKCLGGEFFKLMQLKKKYPHLKTILSIGGWTYSIPFAQALSTNQTRNKFIVSATNLMVTYGFDGIDIDWEFPGIKREGSAASDQDWTNLASLGVRKNF